MNNKQIGGLENANNNEYINQIDILFNNMLESIKSKDLDKINLFNESLNEYIIKIMNTLSIDKPLEKDNFIDVYNISEIFNKTLYFTKNRETSFYKLIKHIDKFIDDNVDDFINKKLNYDIFYFKYN